MLGHDLRLEVADIFGSEDLDLQRTYPVLHDNLNLPTVLQSIEPSETMQSQRFFEDFRHLLRFNMVFIAY